MNSIALSPDSIVARMIGKSTLGNGGYRRGRRNSKDQRENCILRTWALFGSEVAISASSADLEQITQGLALHDFGITHCESLQIVLDFVAENITCRLLDIPADFAKHLKTLDSLIASLGGKIPNRIKPRSPFFRQVYYLVYLNVA